MSRMLSKMNLISVVQQLPKEDIETIQGYVEMIEEENQELKKQLEENQNPLKGIFAQVNDDTLLRDCGNMNAEISELKNQQKEFIEWLENMIIKEKEDLNTIIELMKLPKEDLEHNGAYKFFISFITKLEEILSKYKEIIGGKDE